MAKKNLLSVILSFVHIIITFFTDKLIINFDSLNWVNYVCCKVVLFLILFLGYKFLILVFVDKDKQAIKYFNHFLVCFVPLTLVLLLIYPGIWYASDVQNFFNHAVTADFLYYLHYLSSVFYSVSLMLFPVPSGAIIMQMIMFCIVIAYITKNIFELFNGKKICYLIYIPLLILHTIFYVFYANRPVMFGILYFLVIIVLLIDYFSKSKLSIKKIVTLAILTGITANWRSESIYLVIAIPVLMFIVYKPELKLKSILKVVAPFLIAFVLISLPQKINENSHGDLYSANRNLPMVVNPLSYMLTHDLKGEKLNENLEKINKVLDVEVLKKYPSYTDTPAIWLDDKLIKNFNEEEYKQFLPAYLNVIKDNFPVFLKTKILTFANASSIFIDNFTSKDLYNSNSDRMFGFESTKTIFGYKVRKAVVSILEGKTYNGNSANIIYRLTGNLLLPICFIGVLFIYSIIKKELFLFLLTSMLLGHTFIVFITAPASYFMYYFNIYLSGWFLGIIYLINFINKKKNKTNFV